MSPELYDEVIARVSQHITKQTGSHSLKFEPGLKLASTLRHLAAGEKYTSMRFGFRVAHNTMSVLVREVCHAIRDD